MPGPMMRNLTYVVSAFLTASLGMRCSKRCHSVMVKGKIQKPDLLDLDPAILLTAV